MSQKQDNLIVALDIGSMSTRVLAADVNEGALRYRGHAIVDSVGIRKGLIAELGPAAKTDHVNGDRGIGGSSTAAAVAGYPNITVPAGFFLGLPVGISFFGRAYSEPKLIKLAYAFEQATRARIEPRVMASLDVIAPSQTR